MARRRYISTEISTDKDVNRLAKEYGDFAALLYTWMIPHTDDRGYIDTTDPEEILMRVMPGRRDKSPHDVQEALDAIREMRLIEFINGGIAFPADSFYKYQTYINEKNRRKSDEFNNHNDSVETPQNAANHRTSPENADERRKTPQNAASPSPSPSLTPSINTYPSNPSVETDGTVGALVPQEVCEADASRALDEIQSPPFHDPLEPYPELCDFWAQLLNYIQRQHPKAKMPRIRSKQFWEWRRTLEQLVTIDDYNPVEIIAVLTWLYEEYRPSDAFDWRNQIQAIPPLRKVGGSGQTKFHGVYSAWRNWNTQASQQETSYGTYSNEIWRSFTREQLEEMPGTLEWEAKRQRSANTARDGIGSTQD